MGGLSGNYIAKNDTVRICKIARGWNGGVERRIQVWSTSPDIAVMEVRSTLLDGTKLGVQFQ
jgi:hypothetical protein